MSVRKKIEEIMNSDKGKVFILKDFAHLGCKNTVKSAMLRLCNSGKVKRLLRGTYSIPRYSDFVKSHLTPCVEEVVSKYAERFGGKIAITGLKAANITGATTQVASKVYFATNKRLKNLKIALVSNTENKKFPITIKHFSKHYFLENNVATVLVQALIDLGIRHKREFKGLRRFVKNHLEMLSNTDFSNIPKKWIKNAIKTLIENELNKI